MSQPRLEVQRISAPKPPHCRISLPSTKKDSILFNQALDAKNLIDNLSYVCNFEYLCKYIKIHSHIKLHRFPVGVGKYYISPHDTIIQRRIL